MTDMTDIEAGSCTVGVFRMVGVGEVMARGPIVRALQGASGDRGPGHSHAVQYAHSENGTSNQRRVTFIQMIGGR